MFKKRIEYFNKKIILVFILGAFFYSAFSQKVLNHYYFVSPAVNVGFTFKAGINFGFSLDAGLINPSSNTNLKYGLNFSYYFVSTQLTSNSRKKFHTLRSTNLMVQNNFFDAAIGLGRAKNNWGYGKRNRCTIHGVAADISVAYPNKYSPWIGIKTFHFNQPKWAWFIGPYNSVYAEYKYQMISNQKNIFPQQGSSAE